MVESAREAKRIKEREQGCRRAWFFFCLYLAVCSIVSFLSGLSFWVLFYAFFFLLSLLLEDLTLFLALGWGLVLWSFKGHLLGLLLGLMVLYLCWLITDIFLPLNQKAKLINQPVKIKSKKGVRMGERSCSLFSRKDLSLYR